MYIKKSVIKRFLSFLKGNRNQYWTQDNVSMSTVDIGCVIYFFPHHIQIISGSRICLLFTRITLIAR